jgi:hypothetical protein
VKRRRIGVQEQRRIDQRLEYEAAQRRAREEERRAAEAFLLGADDYTFALIERFGIPAVRRQLALNAEARIEEGERVAREHVRRTFADALALAAKHPSPSFRVVLYTEERDAWRRHSPLGDRCEPRVYNQRSPEVRRRQAERELRKLGVAVEYVDPNKCGDGA